ncbi:MAG TPA: hypothetical protein VG758_02235 [Hyphomicrobiaceae bacterium]|nr:hypothetical protein [Hyphomicrobiaceae bacterium]
MHLTESTAAQSTAPDLARIERTLLESIKLMKRGQRDLRRMRRKETQQVDRDHAAGEGE